jgi:hypothetical protein
MPLIERPREPDIPAAGHPHAVTTERNKCEARKHQVGDGQSFKIHIQILPVSIHQPTAALYVLEV